MQSTLDTLQGHIEAYPAPGADINLSLMDKVNSSLTELKSLAVKHQKSNIFTQFALARKTQSLLAEATEYYTEATSKLHLNIAVSHYGVNLRVDEGVSILVSASDGTDIKLSEMALAITTMAQQQLTILAAVNSFAATTTDRSNITTGPALGCSVTGEQSAITQ
eukprot:1559-Heterococcus_DN1.PRE.1